MVDPSSFILLVVIVVLALGFDFINGMHDTANAIAASVSTRALSPRSAIVLSASMNFLGALIGTEVAKTIGKGIVSPADVTQLVIMSALVAAITWNLITWYFGLPSSSSHALIGGVLGAVAWHAGFDHFQSKGLVKVFSALFLSPLFGFFVGMLLMVAIYWMFRKSVPGKVNRWFKWGQRFTAAFAAFSHGTNDAQKSMGIITMALMSFYGYTNFQVPLWVKLSCALAMALGTSTGGWRIIKTMGGRMIKMTPPNGFAADAGSSLVILTASHFGAPVSTTHVVSSTILGVGASKRFSAVRWGVAGRIVAAWVLTIPATALIAAGTYVLLEFFLKR